MTDGYMSPERSSYFIWVAAPAVAAVVYTQVQIPEPILDSGIILNLLHSSRQMEHMISTPRFSSSPPLVRFSVLAASGPLAFPHRRDSPLSCHVHDGSSERVLWPSQLSHGVSSNILPFVAVSLTIVSSYWGFAFPMDTLALVAASYHSDRQTDTSEVGTIRSIDSHSLTGLLSGRLSSTSPSALRRR